MDVQNKFALIEAIDDPLYYKAAKFLDELIEHLPKAEKPYKKTTGIPRTTLFWQNRYKGLDNREKGEK